MKKKCLAILLALVMAAGLMPGTAFAANAAAPTVTLSTEYTYAGALKYGLGAWTEESYRASPVVADLDGDGRLEVINASYALYVIDAATGAEKWRVSAGRDRANSNQGNVAKGMVFCDPQVADIDGDNELEIVIGYGNGSVSVLDKDGYFEKGWPKQVVPYDPNPDVGCAVRALVVDDLNGDGKMEIIVGGGIENSQTVWVYDCKGNVLHGWPQASEEQRGFNYNLGDTEHYSTSVYNNGVYGNGIITANMDDDDDLEIIVLTDNPFINAYNYDGTLVMASDLFSNTDGKKDGIPRPWGRVGLWEDYNEEIAHKNEGWGFDYDLRPGDFRTRAGTYRAEMGSSAAVYTDVDGDGTCELVVTALMTDRTTHSVMGNNNQTIDDTRYMTVFILNQDRTRFKTDKFDWTSVPNELNSSIEGPRQHYYSYYDSELKTEKKLSSMNGNVFPVPVCADLDGKDGYQEILFNSYDGMVHCFGLDKKELWHYRLPQNKDNVYEYATPVVCKDLDGDGTQEVIFASWLDGKDGKVPAGMKGRLYVLSSEGKELARIDLPDAYNASYNNGVMAAPAVVDIDGDKKYEVLLNTTYYALCVYEINTNAKSSSSTRFTDVPAGIWFDEAVQWAVANSVTDGTGDNKFSPGNVCTHAEIISFLWKAAGRPAAYDYKKAGDAQITENQWYTTAAYWAASKGMIDENFQPSAYCTRAEVAVYIWKAKDMPNAPESKPRFNDVHPENFGGWGSEKWIAINWLKYNEITNGDGMNNFKPDTTITRAEISTILYRAYA